MHELSSVAVALRRRGFRASGRRLAVLTVALATLLAGVATAPSRAADIPAGLMVKIVMAAIAYDHSIDTRFGDTVKVGIVGASGRATEIKSVLEGYADKKLKGKPLELITLDRDDLENQDLDLVFFSEALGGDARRLADACQRQNATCVSADEAGVAAGVPLGVELTPDGKPKLLINLEAAKASGANFSAQVLKLARLVEPK